MIKLFNEALIIDDDVDLCNLLKDLLGKSIPKVSYVHTVESGRNCINEFKPEVIFLDNNLPDGKGFDLIAEIKSISSESLIIIISAVGTTKDEAIKWGADAIIEKPLTNTNILLTLKELQAKAK